MTDPAKLTKDQLLELLKFKSVELQCKEDIIRQLEQKHEDLELAYQKLWHERFSARSERYIADPSQLCLDFGNTDEANDASAGLADAVEEADLIPAHRRRKPRKKRDESLPAHLPRYEVMADVADELKNCPVGSKNSAELKTPQKHSTYGSPESRISAAGYQHLSRRTVF